MLAYLHFVVLPQVIDGLIIGVALALVALGLTMIFGLLDVINLAHGEIYMIGGYAALTLIGWGGGYWSAIVLVPAIAGLAGWALEELGVRPLLPRGDRAVVTLLLTFGVSLVLRDLAQVVFGTETYSISPAGERRDVPRRRSGAALSRAGARDRRRRGRADLVARLPHAHRRGAARDRGGSGHDRVVRHSDPPRLRRDVLLRLRARRASPPCCSARSTPSSRRWGTTSWCSPSRW